MSLLRVEGLAKKYRSRQVVKDLSLEVARGDVVGLLGPTGAGKTTAFYMIVGLVPTDAGRIIIDGQDVSRRPVHRRARLGLGYLPQEPSVVRKLRVRDTIHAILETRPDLDAQRREAEVGFAGEPIEAFAETNVRLARAESSDEHEPREATSRPSGDGPPAVAPSRLSTDHCFTSLCCTRWHADAWHLASK